MQTSRASFVKNSLCKSNRIGAKQHSCLTPVRILTLFVSPWSSGILTFLSVWNFLITFLPVYEASTQFLICVQSSFDYVLSVQIVSVVPYSLLNRKCSFWMYSLVFFSMRLVSILATTFAVCSLWLIVGFSLLFVAFCFFCTEVIVTSLKSLSNCAVSCMLIVALLVWHHFLSTVSISPGTSFLVAFLLLISSIARSILQNIRPVSSAFTFSSGSNCVRSIRSIVLPCNIILPNFQYLSVICCYIPLRVFDAEVLNRIFFPM